MKKKHSNDGEERSLLNEEAESFDWHLTREQILANFKGSLYREIIEARPFQRLNQISFLGAIDYILPGRRSIRKATNTRLQHSLGVARLALLFANRAGLSEKEEKLIVVAALLHDIGHAPLSHSLESIFDAAFSINHHQAGAEVIRGESPLGKGVLRSLKANAIDPDEVVCLIDGKHTGPFAHIFGGPMNIDTFEGILRCGRYSKKPITVNPIALVEGLICITRASQRRFDEFWRTKHLAYQFLINGPSGVYADALARGYMGANLGLFSKKDYYIGEQTLLKKHRQLAELLRKASYNFRMSKKETVDFKSRTFYVNESCSISKPLDLSQRYLQMKTHAQLRIPGSVVRSPDCEQRILFESTCNQ